VYEITEQLWAYARYLRVVYYDCQGRLVSDSGWLPDGYEEEKMVTLSERQKTFYFRGNCFGYKIPFSF